MDEATLREIVRSVEHSGARLLFDETYREMTFGGPLPPAASLSDRAISVSSVSKTYGLPGLRTGWLLTRDRDLRELLLAAKEQIVITGSVVDEELTFRALSGASDLAARDPGPTRCRVRHDPASGSPRTRASRWVEPAGGA